MNLSDDIPGKGMKNKWIKLSSVKRHDLYNFESKIDYRYTLEETKNKKKKTSYLLDIYFFIPQSLQVNKETYNKEQFYSDLNNRIRFKTPQMSIRGILNENNHLSPLNVIKGNLQKIEFGSTEIRVRKTIMRELRLLACIVKTTFKDEHDFLMENYRGSIEKKELFEILRKYLDKIQELKTEMENIGKKIVKTQIPIELKDCFQYSNEYISLQIEKLLTFIITGLERQLDDEIRRLILKFIENEQSYRNSLKSVLTLKNDSSNEEFSYFEGIAKKYVQGVLYLNKEQKNPQSTSLQVLYSIAAGCAMFISLFLGAIVLSIFELNSLPFIIGTVVIYMLKDRIKDIIKGTSQKAVGLYFPDQRIDIVDGFYGEKIGESKEKMYFLEEGKIPPEISKIRHSSQLRSIEEEGKPEDCLIFKKKIILLKNKIDSLHTRRKDISDVSRFNVQNFLRYTDDPLENMLTWNSNKQQIEPINVAKVYHINVVLKLTTSQGKKGINVHYKKYRIIIDQKGIKRVLEPEYLF